MGSEKKKVMVAIDESECSRYALQWTLDNLSQTIHISQLVLFTVQPISDFTYAYTSSFGAARMSLSLSLSFYIYILINYCFFFFFLLLLVKETQLIEDYFFMCGYFFCFTTAPELIRSIQENQNKIASALLEKAKEICANNGV